MSARPGSSPNGEREMFSRRGIMAMFGAAGLAPGLEKLTQVPGAGFPPTPPPFMPQAAVNEAQPHNWTMPPWKAVRLALRDPEALRLVRIAAYRKHQHIGHIDHDLSVLRAMSPMAKVTFQRQRFVEREIASESSEESPWDIMAPIRDRIRSILNLGFAP